MTMITVNIKDQEVLAVLGRLYGGLKDMRPAMENIAQALTTESERQFASQSGPLGGWPALSKETTIPFRTEKGSWPGMMLQVTAGGLAGSVQTSFGYNFARIGSNKPYSAMQFFGGITSPTSMIPGKTIPARPYLPFNPRTTELSAPAKVTVLEILEGYFDRLTS
ncbi:MAG: phage virion morphogenesis protein [Rhodoferax sp.]|nr:phage virion morphogenesis protein [Rhodoferax sp.]